jgi:chitin disaccharide deacetylase
VLVREATSAVCLTRRAPGVRPHAKNASELLAVGADARLLIVNCDDLGMYRAVDLGIVEAITTGVPTTCSLVTPCPGASHAIELLRQHPRIPFGIHLTVVCDLPGHRWGPLAARQLFARD